MKQSTLDTFFHFISRTIILIPLAILVSAVFIKGYTQQKKQSPGSIPSSSQLSITVTPKPSGTGNILDLNVSQECTFVTPTATISAKIKRKMIAATVEFASEEKQVLFKGDCLYMWDKGSIKGEKICGLSIYLMMFNTLSASTLGGLMSVVPALSTSSYKGYATTENANLFINSCTKKDVDDAIFRIPSLSFTEKGSL